MGEEKGSRGGAEGGEGEKGTGGVRIDGREVVRPKERKGRLDSGKS